MNKHIIKSPVTFTFKLPTGETKEITTQNVKIKQEVEIKESNNAGSTLK